MPQTWRKLRKSLKKRNKLFSTLYHIRVDLVGVDLKCIIHRWNPYTQESDVVLKECITLAQMKNFDSVKDNLVQNGNVWVRDKSMDIICRKFTWPLFTHYSGCKKCNNFRYIPLMSFYTGCTVCNSRDTGEYTHFEANERSNKIE